MQIINKWIGKFDPEVKDKIIDAINRFRDIVSSPEFIAQVKASNTFTHTSMSPSEVADKLGAVAASDQMIEFPIKMYTSFNPWTSVNAYHEKGVTYLNSRKIDGMTVKELSGTLAHEWCHGMGFGHPFRNEQGRELSVPYAIGDMVAKWR